MPCRLFSQQTQSLQDQAREALRSIKDDKGVSILDSNMVESVKVTDNQDVTVLIQLTKNYRKTKALIQTHLQAELPWVTKVNVGMAPQKVETNDAQQENAHGGRMKGLKNVKNILAVYSCKGGVGKSTVSVNLAFSLLAQGKKVGIFDADLYGPSLPTMIKAENPNLFQAEDEPEMIQPIEFAGIKAMSYGFATNNKTAILRGPMASQLVAKLIGSTKWDDLDYLVIDFPPGTGDIQLTLLQEMKVKGAVIVTTPQKLAYVDVVKGIEMFESLQVPTVAVIENMAYYKCANCDTKNRIFGMGYTQSLIEQFGIKNSYEVPILEEVSAFSDAGTPFVLALPDTMPIVELYKDIAKDVDSAMSNMKNNKQEVKFDPAVNAVIISEEGKVQKMIDPFELRMGCKCAMCIDEVDGRQILKPNMVPEDVHPTNMLKKGNYAVAVVWSDGHKSSIYPFERLMSDDFADKQ